MIHDVLFSPPQSPCFVLLKVLVSSFSKSRFRPVQSPVSSSSSKSSPILRVPFPSSSKSSPILPDSRSRPLRVLFHPLRPLPSSSKPKKTAERHEAVPPFAWFVPKWNMTLYYFLNVNVNSVGSSSSHFTSGKHFLSISK